MWKRQFAAHWPFRPIRIDFCLQWYWYRLVVFLPALLHESRERKLNLQWKMEQTYFWDVLGRPILIWTIFVTAVQLQLFWWVRWEPGDAGWRGLWSGWRQGSPCTKSPQRADYTKLHDGRRKCSDIVLHTQSGINRKALWSCRLRFEGWQRCYSVGDGRRLSSWLFRGVVGIGDEGSTIDLHRGQVKSQS